MKKVLILTVALFVAMSTAVIAATKDYYQQYRAPMYGTYRPTLPYANKPSQKYHYGNMPPMYGNHRPPMMYGNHKPPMMYGNRPPMQQKDKKQQKNYPVTLPLFDESRPVVQ